MEKKNDGSNMIGRRRALQVLGVGLSTASGLIVLGGCNKTGSQGEQAGGSGATGSGGKGPVCLDKGDIDEAAANLRKVLQYKDKSDTPEKKCSLCAQFEAGKYGDCGGCKLFAGGVNPEGACLSFAPRQTQPAPGVVPPPAAPAAPTAPAAPGKTG